MLLSGNVEAQKFTLASYNCENAFDTLRDEGKNDLEYTPEGDRHWTRYRMYQKLKNIGKVIMSIDTQRPVDIICLEEVENDSVLTYLTQRTALRAIGYDYVMTNSADVRGIDVAIVYSPMTFRLISHHPLRAETSTPTRDILYACGQVMGGDTLHLFAVHLPSKLNGKESQTNRRKVAEAISHSADSIIQIHPHANIVVMGDFNDGIRSTLLRKQLSLFTNLMKGKEPGTYKYQGNWDVIDHILVSPNLLNQHSRLSTDATKARVVSHSFLLENDETYGGTKPFRTFSGYKYNGGYSDHLPVALELNVSK